MSVIVYWMKGQKSWLTGNVIRLLRGTMPGWHYSADPKQQRFQPDLLCVYLGQKINEVDGTTLQKASRCARWRQRVEMQSKAAVFT